MSTGVYGLPNAHITPRAAGPGRPWLITIVDLMTLLLTFFVLLFSMSHVELKRYQAVAKSYANAFSAAVTTETSVAPAKLPKLTMVSGDDIAYLSAVLKAAFADSATLKDIEFHPTSQYLMLSLPVDALFAPQSGAFAEGAKTTVFDLGGVLSNLKNRIAVVGTAAISQADGAAPWALAMARAQTTADALKTAGYDQNVAVLGRGGAATDVSAAIGHVDILILPERPAS